MAVLLLCQITNCEPRWWWWWYEKDQCVYCLLAYQQSACTGGMLCQVAYCVSSGAEANDTSIRSVMLTIKHTMMQKRMQFLCRLRSLSTLGLKPMTWQSSSYGKCWICVWRQWDNGTNNNNVCAVNSIIIKLLVQVAYFVNSGAEANDMAILLARLYTGNHDLIALRNGYHGLSEGLMGVLGHSTWKYNVPLVSLHCQILQQHSHHWPLSNCVLVYGECAMIQSATMTLLLWEIAIRATAAIWRMCCVTAPGITKSPW